MKILVVEDEVKTGEYLAKGLTEAGFVVDHTDNGLNGYHLAMTADYDLIVLDIMLPDVNGWDIVRMLRAANKGMPILLLTALGTIEHRVKGLELGADDYMVKPIQLDELLLRVRALLRRANIEMECKVVVGNLELDADGMTASVDGEELPVTTREFNILYKLLSYPKKTFSRAQLMDEFWGVDTDTSLRAVDVYITKLRDKFSACDGFEIKTVRGLGYKAVLK